MDDPGYRKKKRAGALILLAFVSWLADKVIGLSGVQTPFWVNFGLAVLTAALAVVGLWDLCSHLEETRLRLFRYPCAAAPAVLLVIFILRIAPSDARVSRPIEEDISNGPGSKTWESVADNVYNEWDSERQKISLCGTAFDCKVERLKHPIPGFQNDTDYPQLAGVPAYVILAAVPRDPSGAIRPVTLEYHVRLGAGTGGAQERPYWFVLLRADGSHRIWAPQGQTVAGHKMQEFVGPVANAWAEAVVAAGAATAR
ncbi:MAG TPA: hypothetical protein VHL80_08010 [Polyangia bacterium]|nr:hypothetical protein [Polyangia bacterium]